MSAPIGTAFTRFNAFIETARHLPPPMHKTKPLKRKTFWRVALASTLVVTGATTTALLAGITPATAANLANQPDTQIAVFMVPLTLLVLVLLFEVTRFALRGNLPAQAPAKSRNGRYWNSRRRDS
jgi:hypothetical protein